MKKVTVLLSKINVGSHKNMKVTVLLSKANVP